ncbi:hypothetical protein BGX26_008370, partial [Mortierella sp. AD094]
MHAVIWPPSCSSSSPQLRSLFTQNPEKPTANEPNTYLKSGLTVAPSEAVLVAVRYHSICQLLSRRQGYPTLESVPTPSGPTRMDGLMNSTVLFRNSSSGVAVDSVKPPDT